MLVIAVGGIYLWTKWDDSRTSLQVWEQRDTNTFKKMDETNNQEIIDTYKNWFNDVHFSEKQEGWTDPTGNADIVLELVQPNEGISTRPLSVWIDEDEAIITNEFGIQEESPVGFLSNEKLLELLNILEDIE